MNRTARPLNKGKAGRDRFEAGWMAPCSEVTCLGPGNGAAIFFVLNAAHAIFIRFERSAGQGKVESLVRGIANRSDS